METRHKILEGRLTAYQLSEALSISIDTVNELLDENLKIEELDPETQEKITVLEDALFEQ